MRRAFQIFLSLAAAAAAAAGNPGTIVTVGDYAVELAVEGTSAFRVSICDTKNGCAAPAMVADCPMIAPHTEHAAVTLARDGVTASFGSITLAPTGLLTLTDAAGKVLSRANLSLTTASGHISATFGASATARFYGAGAGHSVGFDLAKLKSQPKVANTELEVSRFWSTDGFAALGVSPLPNNAGPGQAGNAYGASWDAQPDVQGITYSIMGTSADIYLMPSADAFAGVKVHWDLTGDAVLPPRYAFGFMACRWGWQSEGYIEEMLTAFRTGGNTTGGGYPIDAWISDFEWYTPQPDYALSPQGTNTFKDFDFDRKGDCQSASDEGACQAATFPEPEKQLLHYHEDLHFKFGGIRKPRLGNKGNLTMARSKNWTFGGHGHGGGAGGSRNLNYSIPEVRAWYQANQQWYHRINGGAAAVDFWWNDEGETDYFTFWFWNLAEITGAKIVNATKRFWTINRSYSPGMHRIGGAVWTGDISVTWQELANQGGYLTNWVMAGIPYITCDTGGFGGPNDPPDLLVRWYQLAAHLPVMRVHSTHSDQPHFPFLYGQAAGDAMRKTLHHRYSLIPYHYSNAHRMYAEGRPAFRPMLMDFPEDETAGNVTTQWMDGDALIVAPIVESQPGPGKIPAQTAISRDVYLPRGLYYVYNTTKTIKSSGGIVTADAGLDESPLFVLAGSIVPLAPELQYSNQLPGGPVDVHVYPGKNCKFEMVEDDGETTGYKTGAIRTTTFSWDDATKTLSWAVTGSFAGDAHSFVLVKVIAHFPSTASATVSVTKQLGTSGSIAF